MLPSRKDDVTETLTMSQRTAGQGAMEYLLHSQRSVRPRTTIARLLGRSPLDPGARPLYLAAQAQRAVGGMLELLGPGWSVIHSAPGGAAGAEIEHVVIGPAGVFTVGSKQHRNQKVWVAETVLVAGGLAQDHIREATRHAGRVGTILENRMALPVRVVPLVAIVDAREITIRRSPADVHVLDGWQLRAWLRRLPPVLDDRQVAEATAILDDPDSWGAGERRPGAGGAAPARNEELVAEFSALDADVRSATARRAGWKVVAYAVAVTLPIVAFPYLVDWITALAGG